MYTADGSHGDWKLSDNGGKHVLHANLTVPSCSTENGKVTVGQIHTVDASLPIVIEMQWINGKASMMYSTKDSSVHKYKYHVFRDEVGHNNFYYTIVIDSGYLVVTVGGETFKVDVSGWGSTLQYFKAGDYVQSNVGNYMCTVSMSRLCVAHGKTRFVLFLFFNNYFFDFLVL